MSKNTKHAYVISKEIEALFESMHNKSFLMEDIAEVLTDIRLKNRTIAFFLENDEVRNA